MYRDSADWLQAMGSEQYLRKGLASEGARLTCSPVSSLRANFTLPMLPAPTVLPRIHFPDGVGIVVRDLLCLEAEAEAEEAPVGLRGSVAPWATGAGPALLATAVFAGMSLEVRLG